MGCIVPMGSVNGVHEASGHYSFSSFSSSSDLISKSSICISTRHFFLRHGSFVTRPMKWPCTMPPTSASVDQSPSFSNSCSVRAIRKP